MVLDEAVLAECRRPKLASLDEQRAPDATADAKEHKDQQFEDVPVRCIANFEQHNLVRTIRIQELERERSNNTAKEGAEECLWWEVVAHFLQTEQNATYWRAKGDCYTASRTSTEDLSPFRYRRQL